MPTTIGAAWTHGRLPPWMEQPPGYDESDAADRAALVATLVRERFGALSALSTENDRAPSPIPTAQLPNRARIDSGENIARRRAVLNDALGHDTTTDRTRWAA